MALLAVVLASGPVHAQVGDNGFYVENVTADGAFFFPTDIAVAPSGRMYVAHKQGWINVVEPDGTVRAERFFDIQSEVHSAVDRGLLGIALDPDFPAEPYLYFYYMRLDPTSTGQETPFTFGRLERVTATGPDLATADLSTRTVLLGQDYRDAPVGCEPFHGGATVAFAPDGSLLLSTGDSGFAGDPDVGGRLPDCFGPDRADPVNDIGAFRAQSLNSLNGKILRLDPATGAGLPDNPFYTGDPEAPASKVWALGLRNPFRLTVDPTADGEIRVAVGDVGWFTYEEVNVATGGENFGWPCYEGVPPQARYADIAPSGFACDEALAGALTEPAAQWHHSEPARSIPAGLTAQSVTGGAFYTGMSLPEAYHGALFVADFAAGWLMALQMDDGEVTAAERVLAEVNSIVDVEVSPDGSLLLLDLFGGRILRLRNTGGGVAPPVARAEVSPQQGLAPLPVTFSAGTSFDPAGGDLQAEWAFGDGVTASGDVVDHVYEATGRYRATLTVTNEDGRATQTTATVIVGRGLPVLEILEPIGAPIRAGTLVPLQAEATDPLDPEDPLAVRWEARLVHNSHEHPAVYTTDTPTGMLPALPHGTFEELSYYTVTASVTDREGLTVSRTVALPLVPAEIATADIASTEPLIEFERTVRVRSVCVPTSGLTAEAIDVAVRRDGNWTTPEFAQAIEAADGTCVLFVEAEGDAVRVARDAGMPTVQLRLGQPGDLPDGLETVVIGGDGNGQGAAATTETGLVLSTEGGGETVTYRSVSDDQGVEALVADRLGTGSAGVLLRTSLDGGADTAELEQTSGGQVVLRTALRGVTRIDSLGVFPDATALRLQRTREGLRADAKPPTTDWETLARTPNWPTGPQLAGVLARSEGDFVVWFDALEIGRDDTMPPLPPQGLALRTLSPNPSMHSIEIDAVVAEAGAYRLEVFDALGRMVHAESRVASLPPRFRFQMDLPRLPAGAYVLRIQHPASGDVLTVPFTRIR